MRNVLKNSAEVAWAWANGIDRAVRAGNVYTSHDGQTIFCYGSHFPMGKFCEHDGNRFVVLNPRTYSSSTSKRQYEVRHALSGVTIVYGVPGEYNYPTDRNHEKTPGYYKYKLVGLLEGLAKARKKEKWTDQIVALTNQATAYYAAFGIPLPHDLTVASIEQYRESVRLAEAETTRIRLENMARELAKFEGETLPKWRSGETVDNYLYSLPEVFFGSKSGRGVRLDYMRLDRNSYIVTTQNVAIPKPAARALWQQLMELPADYVPSPYGDEPVQIAGYSLREFNKHYVTFNCHSFTWDELRHAAKLVSADRPDRRHPIEEAVAELA